MPRVMLDVFSFLLLFFFQDGHVTFLIIGDWGRKSQYIEALDENSPNHDDLTKKNLLYGFLNQTAVASAMNYVAGMPVSRPVLTEAGSVFVLGGTTANSEACLVLHREDQRDVYHQHR